MFFSSNIVRSFKLQILLLTIVLSVQVASDQPPSNQKTFIIVVKENDNEVVFDKIAVGKGETMVLSDSSIIALILPLSEGKAADFIKQADRTRAIVIKYNDGQVHVTFKSRDGKEKTYPPVSYEKLQSYQIRVNLISGSGYRRAFVINNYSTIKEDNGPVIDLFGGKIPMGNGDYSLTVETKIGVSSQMITGEIPFEKIDGWIVIDGKFPDGRAGKFIMDTGASSGLVIAQNFLPPNIKISKLTSVAHSRAGTVEKKGQMLGATGNVEDGNFMGAAELPSIRLGDMNFENTKTTVLKNLPEFLKKHNIVGIVGLGILRKAAVVSIENVNQTNGVIKFMKYDSAIENSSDKQFSLRTAGGLLFVKGEIQNTHVNFIFDTGARKSLIGSRLTAENRMIFSNLGETKTIGIDGKKAEAVKAMFQEIRLENCSFKNVGFKISNNLFILKTIGLEKTGAILGMSFFSRFKTMRIDFAHNKLSLKN